MRYLIARRRDLQRAGQLSELWPHALLVQNDANAALWRVTVTDGGQDVDLSAWTIHGEAQRPSGVTVELTGSAQGGVASVVLGAACFAEGGELQCHMYAAQGEDRITLDMIRIPVRPYSVDRIIDEEDLLPSLPEFLEQLGRLEHAIDAAQELTDTPAYIGEDGNWYVFDTQTLAYIDSGVCARGSNGSDGAAGPAGRDGTDAAANLLDNSDFRNPVNQRGESSYSAVGFTIDRWEKKTANGTLQPNASAGYVSFIGDANGTCYIVQNLNEDEHMCLGKTYTFAISLANGTIYTVSAEIPSQALTVQTDLAKASVAGGEIAIVMLPNRSALRVYIKAGANAQVDVAWAALYEGEFTAETLPPYRPKGFAAELAECQRYLYVVKPEVAFLPMSYGIIKGASRIWYPIEFPTKMRVAPTFSYGGGGAFVTNTSLYDYISSIELKFADKDRALLDATTQSEKQTGLDSVSILCGNSGSEYLEFSAEL